jgi:hypothetical protein
MRVENSTKMVGELRTKMDIIEAKMSAGDDEGGRTMKTMIDNTKSKSDTNSFDFHEDQHKDMVVDDSVTSQINITRNRQTSEFTTFKFECKSYCINTSGNNQTIKYTTVTFE